MSDISEIHQELFKNTEPRRVVLKVHTDKLDPQDYHTSVGEVVNEIFPDWKADDRVLFLAIEIWGDRTFMAIDLNNHDYDFEQAHKVKPVLPVYVLWKHRRKGWILVRWPQEDQSLAEKIAYLHNANGFTETPFLEDHNSQVIHANPREFPA